MIKLIIITALCILYLIKRAPERFSIPATNLNKWGILLFPVVLTFSGAFLFFKLKMISAGPIDFSNRESLDGYGKAIENSSMFYSSPILFSVSLLLTLAALAIIVMYFMDFEKKKLSVRQILTLSGVIGIVYILVNSVTEYYVKIVSLQTAGQSFWWMSILSESDISAEAVSAAFSASRESFGVLLIFYLFHYMNVKKWYDGVPDAVTIEATSLTPAEQEYLKEYKECLSSGSISDSERRLLEKLREKSGISEARAKELEGLE